jgi:hypothetical protein
VHRAQLRRRLGGPGFRRRLGGRALRLRLRRRGGTLQQRVGRARRTRCTGWCGLPRRLPIDLDQDRVALAAHAMGGLPLEIDANPRDRHAVGRVRRFHPH